ncbi:hypothetical protein ElyMa_005448500 [Elysia marginata]|uniref:Uncharacterized protein n=1 Tax=Elysia marginata TaxID=1093978 RepID=A0AAV4EMV8_9GAST|nr:hypothetical protein ElyMa_005448500 [Elysia marginata]
MKTQARFIWRVSRTDDSERPVYGQETLKNTCPCIYQSAKPFSLGTHQAAAKKKNTVLFRARHASCEKGFTLLIYLSTFTKIKEFGEQESRATLAKRIRMAA